MNQQSWCWGYDVGGEAANLLLEYGFSRTPPPVGLEKCSSVYRLDVSATRRVILRGFGVFYGNERWGGLFLPRFKWEPRLTPYADLSRPPWQESDLPPCRRPAADDRKNWGFLLDELLEWIVTYECWIIRRRGVAYRHRAIAAWKYGRRKPFDFAAAMALWPRLRRLLMDGADASSAFGDAALVKTLAVHGRRTSQRQTTRGRSTTACAAKAAGGSRATIRASPLPTAMASAMPGQSNQESREEVCG
jgi:hypothetical protein